MSTPAVEHKCVLHTYSRNNTIKGTFRCTHPRCSHYTKRELLFNKEALCPSCFNPFILTPRKLQRKNPKCDSCTGTSLKKEKVTEVQISKVDELLKIIGLSR